MITINQLRNDIASIRKEMEALRGHHDRSSIGQLKRMQARIKKLQELSLYLEGSPSEAFLLKEEQRLQDRISAIMELYIPLDDQRFQKKQVTAHRKEFEAKWEIPKTVAQLKTIRYILKRK